MTIRFVLSSLKHGISWDRKKYWKGNSRSSLRGENGILDITLNIWVWTVRDNSVGYLNLGVIRTQNETLTESLQMDKENTSPEPQGCFLLPSNRKSTKQSRERKFCNTEKNHTYDCVWSHINKHDFRRKGHVHKYYQVQQCVMWSWRASLRQLHRHHFHTLL